MRRADVIAAISTHRDEIARRFGVRSLSLFGSVARDEARPDSPGYFVQVDLHGPRTADFAAARHCASIYCTPWWPQ